VVPWRMSSGCSLLLRQRIAKIERVHASMTPHRDGGGYHRSAGMEIARAKNAANGTYDNHCTHARQHAIEAAHLLRMARRGYRRPRAPR
jgi:hypothetical protein